MSADPTHLPEVSPPEGESARKARKPRQRAAPPQPPAVDRDLVVRSTPDGVELALLEEGHLVELHRETSEVTVNVGDVYLGRVRKLSPGLNAAFVDIGYPKEAFLHHSDLGPQLRSMLKFANGAISGGLPSSKLEHVKREADIVKGGPIASVLKPKQPLLLQVSKEPISTKGPRVSAELNLPGRYMVLTPFGRSVNVSKKIESREERQRLKELVQGMCPEGFGVIVRTAAEGKPAGELLEEVDRLLGQWDAIYKACHRARPPRKLLSELDKTTGLLRDLLSDAFNRVVTDDDDTYQAMRAYLAEVAPTRLDVLKLHKGTTEIFAAYGVKRQIQASFGKTVTFANGAYLVIEATEAMHVVDVNSGAKVGTRHAEALLRVNLDAAREVARQLRLRDLGGLIVIDFIDMKDPEHRTRLHREMKAFMARDRAQHTILPLSKFGLMQITRQRVRPAVEVATGEVCPTCKGTGEVNPTELVTDDIERDLLQLLDTRPKSRLTLRCHPFVHAFLTKGVVTQQHRWLWRHQTWLRVEPAEGLGMTEYRFLDQRGEEVRFGEA